MTGYYRAMASKGKAINDGSKVVTLAGGEMVGGQTLWVKVDAAGVIVAKHGFLPAAVIGGSLADAESAAVKLIRR